MKLSGEEMLVQHPASRGWEPVEVPPDSNEFAELIAWLDGGPEHRSTGRQARYTVEIMMAIYESLRRRQLIHMPLDNKTSPIKQMIADGTLPVRIPGKYDIRAPKDGAA